jgi:hypothetical protein
VTMKQIVSTLITLGMSAAGAADGIPQIDMEAQMKWGSADVIHYHVVGEYKGSPHIGEPNNFGVADVTDRVGIDFDWSQSTLDLVGTVAIENAPSDLRNLRNWEPKCAAPSISGTYEHLDLQSVERTVSGGLLLHAQAHVPAIDVPQFCTGKARRTPEHVEEKTLELVVVSTMPLWMSVPNTEKLGVAPDRKSIYVKDGDWTWTFTPSVQAAP